MKSRCKLLKDKQKMKIQEQTVFTQIRVGVLLTNCYTCMRGNSVSVHYKVPPPTLESYLTGW